MVKIEGFIGLLYRLHQVHEDGHVVPRARAVAGGGAGRQSRRSRRCMHLSC